MDGGFRTKRSWIAKRATCLLVHFCVNPSIIQADVLGALPKKSDARGKWIGYQAELQLKLGERSAIGHAAPSSSLRETISECHVHFC